MPTLRRTGVRPQQIRQPVAAMRVAPLDGEKRQQRQVLSGAEPDGLPTRAAKLGTAQAAQEVAWWHVQLVGRNHQLSVKSAGSQGGSRVVVVGGGRGSWVVSQLSVLPCRRSRRTCSDAVIRRGRTEIRPAGSGHIRAASLYLPDPWGAFGWESCGRGWWGRLSPSHK